MITAARIRTFKYLRASYISFPNVMAKVYLNFYKITIAWRPSPNIAGESELLKLKNEGKPAAHFSKLKYHR